MATIEELESDLAQLRDEFTRLHERLSNIEKWETVLVKHHLAVGTFDPASWQGSINAAGPAAELGFVNRDLTPADWQNPRQPGDRFVWYNKGGVARLYTDIVEDLLTVSADGALRGKIGNAARAKVVSLRTPYSSSPSTATVTLSKRQRVMVFTALSAVEIDKTAPPAQSFCFLFVSKIDGAGVSNIFWEGEAQSIEFTLKSDGIIGTALGIVLAEEE